MSDVYGESIVNVFGHVETEKGGGERETALCQICPGYCVSIVNAFGIGRDSNLSFCVYDAF